MKFIASIQGTYAFDFSGDDISPDAPVLMRDLVSFIGDMCDFSLKPELAPGLPPDQMYMFQSGAIVINKIKTPIRQLVISPSAWALTAKDTDTAERLTTILAAAIDEKYGFKFLQAIKATYYMSFIIIEFHPGLEKQLAVFGRIKEVLEREIPRPNFAFDLKRLAFGASDKQAVMAMQTIEGISASDFTIERRAGEPHTSNRYFSSAPLSTSEHQRILNLIEETMRD